MFDLDSISVPENARDDFRTDSKELFLRISSRYCDSLVGQRWSVPIQSWSDAWVWAVCEIAFCRMVFGKRGYNPSGKTEQTLSDRYKEAKEWVQSARDYEVTPDPRLVMAEPMQVATVFSDPQRGWSSFTSRRR